MDELHVQVEGGRTMKLRVNDPAYLGHVDRFWNVLLPKMAPYLYHRGGPILMTQARCTFKAHLWYSPVGEEAVKRWCLEVSQMLHDAGSEFLRSCTMSSSHATQSCVVLWYFYS